MPLTIQKWLKINGFLFGILFLVFIFCLFVGSPVLSPHALFENNNVVHDIFFHARLPRVLLSIFVGMALSSSGVAFQSLLRNPLADPYLLGVSGGAALGGAIAMAFSFPVPLIFVTSFIAALLTLFLIYSLAQVEGRLPVHALLLTGVVFNAFAFALILLINSLVTLGEAHQMIYLLMGSLESSSLKEVLWMGFFTLLGFSILCWQSPRMNVVGLGDEPAQQLGVAVDRERTILFFASSIMVGASVALAGLIGFVGLFVPHMIRLLFGSDHRLVLPASAIGGAIFLMLCDFVARTLFAGAQFQTQLPVGVITALIGGPFFVYLMKKS